MSRDGRPPKYSEEEILKKTQEYIDMCEDKFVKLNKLGTKIKIQVKIPTLEGLALYLDVHKDTIQEWKKTYPNFSVFIGKLLQKQAEALINKGLSGDYNPTIAKVLLTKHGYREAVDTDITSKDEKINVVDASALKLAKEYEEKLKETL